MRKRPLREEFAQVEKDRMEGRTPAALKLRAKAEETLSGLAADLKEKVKGQISDGVISYHPRHKKDPFVHFDLPVVVLPQFPLQEDDIQGLPGYKKLLEACERADVKIALSPGRAGAMQIDIHYKSPYKDSPHVKHPTKTKISQGTRQAGDKLLNRMLNPHIGSG